MSRWLLVALGGALGTGIRYFVCGLNHRFFDGSFPFHTLLINLSGSFAAGFLWGFFQSSAGSSVVGSSAVKAFIFIGILGGFTTFSTFNLENFNLIRAGELKMALFNVAVSNIVGIGLLFAGFFLAQVLVKGWKGAV